MWLVGIACSMTGLKTWRDLKHVFIIYFDTCSYLLQMNNNRAICPICKNKLTEHSELQYKICNMIIIKQFANNCPGFDVQFRPFFEKEES
jgi:hypothetical protein